MALKYKIKITIVTPLGTFTGFGTEEAYSLEEVTEARKEVVSLLNRLTHLVIYSEDGEQRLFNENILKQSVLQMKIVSVLSKE